MSYTISVHCDSIINLNHNLRNKETIKKENLRKINKIDLLNGNMEIWENKFVNDYTLKDIYDEIFTNDIEKYNIGKKPSRHLYGENGKEYFEKIKNDRRKSVQQELIFEIGNIEHKPNDEICKKILKDVFNDFQKKYGNNCYITSAVYHNDEENKGPHLHITFLYISKNNNRGIKTQISQTGALKEMGIKDNVEKVGLRFGARKFQFYNELREMVKQNSKKYNIDADYIVHAERIKRLSREDYTNKKIRQKIKNQKIEYKNIKQKYNKLKNECNELQNDCKIKSQEYNKAKQKYSEMSEKFKNKKISYQELQNSYFEMKNKYAEKQEAYKTKQKKYDELNKAYYEILEQYKKDAENWKKETNEWEDFYKRYCEFKNTAEYTLINQATIRKTENIVSGLQKQFDENARQYQQNTYR